MEGLSRRTFLGVGSVSLASAALASLAVNAQERPDTENAEQDHSVSNPGPERDAASLPYGDRGAGTGIDCTQQPDNGTGRDREGNAGAHTAGSAGCRVDGRGDCTAADRRTLQLHHGMRPKQENAMPNR
jgi:hypothetical protein